MFVLTSLEKVEKVVAKSAAVRQRRQELRLPRLLLILSPELFSTQTTVSIQPINEAVTEGPRRTNDDGDNTLIFSSQPMLAVLN